ncbi:MULTISPECIES: hypothetical protein [unclassified Microcoleus]|uniref:hypothetical protein n=1 Tax=unclassified Microcoleus TaxID=2642155 RepID=UPI002FD15DA8
MRLCNAGIPDWFKSSIAKVLKFLAEYAVSFSNASWRRSTSKYRGFSGFTAATSSKCRSNPDGECEASLLGWMSCDQGFFWVCHSKIRCSQNEPLLAIVRKTPHCRSTFLLACGDRPSLASLPYSKAARFKSLVRRSKAPAWGQQRLFSRSTHN